MWKNSNKVGTGLIAGLRKQTISSVSEVDEYLNTGTISDIPVVSYWKGASDRYPARDILGFPASAVQSERENSKARYLITDNRNIFSSKTVQASISFKSWNNVLPNEFVTVDQ